MTLTTGILEYVDLVGSAVVTIEPSIVIGISLGKEAPGATTLTLNGAATLQFSSTTIANGNDQVLTVGGTANLRTGDVGDGGHSNVHLVKNGGTGELILDGFTSSDMGGAKLSVIAGTMSIEGGGALLSPISTLTTAIEINGPSGKLRFGTPTGSVGTTFVRDVLANASGTLEHSTATDDSIGSVTATGQTLTANITAGALAVTGTYFGGVIKSGGGTMRLAGTSVLSAAAINAGRLEITGSSATFAAMPSIASGGTLALLASTGTAVPGSFSLATGTLEIVQGALGSSPVSLSGGTLRLSAVGAAPFTNPVTASGNSLIDVASGVAKLDTLTLSAGVNLTKAGAGVLELVGATASTGTTTIGAGTLRIMDGVALPSGAITDNGVLEIKRTAASTLANAITGTGTVTHSGAGMLNLNGAQGYATLNIIAGAGTTNVNGAFTSGTATVNANATTNFTVSQKLAALNIGTTAFAGGSSAFQSAPMVVPEPGVLGLLLIGALGGLSRRRR